MAEEHLNTPVEIWKPVLGFPGYEVSNQGRVRSYYRACPNGQLVVTTPQKILKSHSSNSPYPSVSLAKNGKYFRIHVHRLILLSFVGPPAPGYEACHNDGIPTHCTLDNLRWDTISNNHLDKNKHGTMSHGTKRYNSKFTDEQILEIRSLHANNYRYQREIAKMFNVSASVINSIVNHKSWKHLP